MSYPFTQFDPILVLTARIKELEIQSTSNVELNKQLLEKIEKLKEEKKKEIEISYSMETNIDDDIIIRCCCCNVKWESPGIYGDIEFLCCASGGVNPLINDNNYYKCKYCVCILHIETGPFKKTKAILAVKNPPRICCLKRVSSAFLLQSKVLEDYKKENKLNTTMTDVASEKIIDSMGLMEFMDLFKKTKDSTNEQLLKNTDPLLEILDPSISVIKSLLMMLDAINNNPSKHIQHGVNYGPGFILAIPRNFNVEANVLLAAKFFSILCIILNHKTTIACDFNANNSNAYGFKQNSGDLTFDYTFDRITSLEVVKKITRSIFKWFSSEFNENILETYSRSFDEWCDMLTRISK